MLDKYKKNQSLFYNYITRCFANGRISHAYLIEENGISYGYDLAKDLAKFFLCEGKYDERICELVDKNLYSDFILVDSENMIKKEEILNIQEEFSYKPTLGKKKVYLIKNAASLNDFSANSLLKFLEEPSDNIIAILLTNSVNNVKETIVSRCQVINLINNESFDYRTIFDYFDEQGDKDDFIKNEYDKFLNFYLNLENNKGLVLKDKDIYDFSSKLNQLLKFGLYLYFDLISVILESANGFYLPDSDVKKQILDKNSIDRITKKIDLLNEYIYLNRYNVNKNLFLDNFVIKFGGD